MTTRTVGPASGWRWLMNAVNLGGSNPKAIFGGAALIVLLVFVAAVVLSVAAAVLAPTGAGPAQLLLSLLITAPLLVLMAGLLVGYLRLIDAVENGRPAAPTQVLSGFSDRGAWLRAMGLLLVLAVLQYVLIGGAVMLVAPEAGRWYVENMSATEPAALPPGFGRAFAVAMVVGVLVYAAQAIGLGQVALRGRGVGQALADGATGAIRNVLPLVVLMLLGLVAMFVIGIVVGLLAMLFAAFGSGSGVVMVLAIVIGVPLYLALVLAMIVVSFGVMYAMWRDICGDAGGDAPRGHDHVAA